LGLLGHPTTKYSTTESSKVASEQKTGLEKVDANSSKFRRNGFPTPFVFLRDLSCRTFADMVSFAIMQVGCIKNTLI